MGARKRYRRGDRVCDRMHGAGTILAREGRDHCVVAFDSGRCEVIAAKHLSSAEDDGLRPSAPAQKSEDDLDAESPATAPTSALVVTLNELRALFLAIDAGTVDRRYVDFGAVAERLRVCIDAAGEPPA